MKLYDFYIKILNVLASLDSNSKSVLTNNSMDINYTNENGKIEILKLIIKGDKIVAILYEGKYILKCIMYYEFHNDGELLSKIVNNSYNMLYNSKNLL